jgi:predicted ATPase
MPIKSLTIQNFKGVGSKQVVPLLPITLLFGPNSAGKSTVLHALNYLNDLVNRFDPNGGSGHHGSTAMDLGGFGHFVHQHDKTRSIYLSAELDLDGEDLFETRVNRAYRQLYEASSPEQRLNSGLVDLTPITARVLGIIFSFEVAWSNELDGPFVRRLGIRINEVEFASVECSDDARSAKISSLFLDHEILGAEDVDGWKAVARTAFADRFFPDDGSAVISLAGTKHAIPDWRNGLEFGEVWRELANDEKGTQLTIAALLNCMICGSLEALGRELEGLRYIGPLRDIPGRARRAQGPNAAWGAGLAAWDLVARDAAVRSAANIWLNHDHLGLGYALVSQPILEVSEQNTIDSTIASEPLDRYKRLLLRDTTRQVDVYPHDVGIGVSQLMPVVIGALAREATILAVEQPELHIHPRLQTALGDLFVHAAEQGKTLLLETHSEHLMLRLLRRIRETNEGHESPGFSLSAEALQVLYVECVDGETRISPLRVSDSGRFVDRWPHGFFDERFEEQ